MYFFIFSGNTIFPGVCELKSSLLKNSHFFLNYLGYTSILGDKDFFINISLLDFFLKKFFLHQLPDDCLCLWRTTWQSLSYLVNSFTKCTCWRIWTMSWRHRRCTILGCLSFLFSLLLSVESSLFSSQIRKLFIICNLNTKVIYYFFLSQLPYLASFFLSSFKYLL